MTTPQEPSFFPPPNPRFTLELEFVTALSNPYYLSHLASTYPHLLNPPSEEHRGPPSADASDSSSDTDAECFARYIQYLHATFSTPTYAKYLTHPGATLRALRLLGEERFRREVIRPDVVERLLGLGALGGEGQGGTEGEKGGEEGQQQGG